VTGSWVISASEMLGQLRSASGKPPVHGHVGCQNARTPNGYRSPALRAPPTGHSHLSSPLHLQAQCSALGAVYLGSPVWCVRALLRSKVDGFVLQTQPCQLENSWLYGCMGLLSPSLSLSPLSLSLRCWDNCAAPVGTRLFTNMWVISGRTLSLTHTHKLIPSLTHTLSHTPSHSRILPHTLILTHTITNLVVPGSLTLQS
jgi:hypothetical protein